MLESGSLDAFASDKIKLIGLATQAKDPGKLALLNDDLSYEPLAFALPRGDSTLRLEVNKALTRVYAGGEIERDLRAMVRRPRPSDDAAGGDVRPELDSRITIDRCVVGGRPPPSAAQRLGANEDSATGKV